MLNKIKIKWVLLGFAAAGILLILNSFRGKSSKPYPLAQEIAAQEIQPQMNVLLKLQQKPVEVQAKMDAISAKQLQSLDNANQQ